MEEVKVGVIVYSKTGNTYSVAEKLKDKLAEAGHDAVIERITTVGKPPDDLKSVQFDNRPDVEPYDLLIFASPVHAFSLSIVMNAYMTQLASLKGKKIACYVTKSLPGKWTGGNRAIAKMKQICEEKGGTIIGSEIIVYSSRRMKAIDLAVENLLRYVKG